MFVQAVVLLAQAVPPVSHGSKERNVVPPANVRCVPDSFGNLSCSDGTRVIRDSFGNVTVIPGRK